jgi:hypothetical protein
VCPPGQCCCGTPSYRCDAEIVNFQPEESLKRRRKVSQPIVSPWNDPPGINDMGASNSTIADAPAAQKPKSKSKRKENANGIKKRKKKRAKVREALPVEKSGLSGDDIVPAGSLPPAGDNVLRQSPCSAPQSNDDYLKPPKKPRSKRKAPISPYFKPPAAALATEITKSPKGSKVSVVETEIDLPSLPHFRPTSPGEFGLIQEKLRHEPWKMLVAVIFLNVTTAKVALPLLGQLFERWPSPEALSQGRPSLQFLI